MPGKKSGNGKVADLTVEILREIRNELRELRGDVAKLTGRFDHFLEFAGKRYQDQTERIGRLEQRVFGGEPPRQ